MSNTDQIKYLLSAKAIRERTGKLYELTLAGKTNFEIHEDKLEEVSDYVLEVIKENYPKLDIPFHSRWGHFRVGDIDRSKIIDEKLKNSDPIEMARTKLDLVITSVLLDAGAGPAWKYNEDGKIYNRSEGLGVASFHMFKDGYFSNDNSLTADAKKMQTITASDIEKAFQVTKENPLIGTNGRANLLCAMGKCVESKPEIFKDGRPGNIIDHMIEKYGMTFEAEDLMKAVLYHFGDIWPSRINIEGTNLGDVWTHPLLGSETDLNSLVPFHKLSQWLTYSLIEPIEEAGVKVINASKMTGLAEYRNGGLILDTGLITLKNSENFNVAHKPDSEIIIEWRALTIVLLDKIADIIRKKLGFSLDEFPLAKVLEGGTWWAGRKVAKSLREDSSPPLKLDSDGTVF
jgi:hypothetical protein